MYKVVNNNIYVIRGDSIKLKIAYVNQACEPINPLREGDTVTLTIKKSTRDRDILIQKDFTDNVLIINPDETELLDYGRYVYDVQLKRANGFIDTIIPPHQFNIDQEVNF